MEKNYLENNSLTLIGKITDDKTFSHEIYSEKFYTVNVSVPRLSGNADLIPVTISERLFKDSDLTIGRNIKVEGQFRSYNSYEKEKNRLILTVFAKSIEFIEDEIDNIESTQGRRNARFCSEMTVGTEVKIIGRVQSRNYEKKYGDGTVEQRVAYEVSVANLELINNEENQAEEKEIEE